MKMIGKKCLAIFVLIMVSFTASSQDFSRGEQLLVQPAGILIENYSKIVLPPLEGSEPWMNRFNNQNIYTYIQVLEDNTGKKFHLLFQENFMRKIIFLACSNNLQPSLTGKNKALNVFVNCIRQVNLQFSSLQVADAATNCILDRLND